MEKIILLSERYVISKSNNDCALEVAEFIVRENQKHHNYEDLDISLQMVEKILNFEKSIDNSTYFLVRTLTGTLIGSIRVFHWDKRISLPIEEMFDVNPLIVIGNGQDYSYWHVGRFAISSCLGFSTIKVFKLLMKLAITPIVQDKKKSFMIAEIDCKLLRAMNHLGIETTTLGKPRICLFSMTAPICSTKKGLITYYNSVCI